MKKRLLFIPLHYNATPRPHEDWFNALNVEFDCDYYDKNMLDTRDYIFIQSGAIDPQMLIHIRNCINSANASAWKEDVKVIQWTGDARAELMENVLQYKGIVDLTLLAVGIGQKEMYEKALGSPVGYLQQGVFELFFMEPKKLTEGKIVFVGNNYDQFEGAVERAELCERLSKEFPKFEVIGNGFDSYSHAAETRLKRYNNTRSIPYEESARIYNESYISISHACFNDIEGYYSNRTLDIMAAGGFCLMKQVPKTGDHKELLGISTYNTIDDCISEIRIAIERPNIRNMLAWQGHQTAKKYHTFAYRAKEIKQLIEQRL